MKKNKKGFTLVELLAVIVILGIILTIAGTNVVKSIKIANQQEVEKFAKMLTDLGPDVYLNEKQATSSDVIDAINDDNIAEIPASVLKNAGYLKSVPKLGKKTCAQANLYIYKGTEIEYKAYILCDGKENTGGSDIGTQDISSLKPIN